MRCRPSPSTTRRSATSAVDRKARVHVRGAWYSVPARLCGRRLDALIGAETIEVLDGASVVAIHPRSRKGEESLVLDHYLEVLAIKPGALLGATALARARAKGASPSAMSGSGSLLGASWATARAPGRSSTCSCCTARCPQPRPWRPGSTPPSGRITDPGMVAIEARRVAEATSGPIVAITRG